MLKQIAKLSKTFYREHLKAKLEPKENGKFVAIEPKSQQYFVHEQAAYALDIGQKTIPDGYFYLMKIGSPHAFRIR